MTLPCSCSWHTSHKLECTEYTLVFTFHILDHCALNCVICRPHCVLCTVHAAKSRSPLPTWPLSWNTSVLYLFEPFMMQTEIRSVKLWRRNQLIVCIYLHIGDGIHIGPIIALRKYLLLQNLTWFLFFAWAMGWITNMEYLMLQEGGLLAALAREAILRTRKYKRVSTHAQTDLGKTAVVQI